MTEPVYILGGCQTDFARAWSRQGQDISDMVREATLGALQNCQLETAAIRSVGGGAGIDESSPRGPGSTPYGHAVGTTPSPSTAIGDGSRPFATSRPLMASAPICGASRGAVTSCHRHVAVRATSGAPDTAGAIASVEGIVHPISAARLVLEETNHVLLVGPFAGKFSRHFKLKRHRSTGPSRRFPYDRMLSRHTRSTREGHGTVGAVALDRSGTVAAGASTGGVESMLPGRVGDTPLIGCGVYADNQSGAVSMTGIGEGIIRLVIAKSICDRLAMGNSPTVAARQVLRMLVARIRGSAGALVLSPDGRFAIRHVTPYMAAGWWNGTGQPNVRGQFP